MQSRYPGHVNTPIYPTYPVLFAILTEHYLSENVLIGCEGNDR